MKSKNIAISGEVYWDMCFLYYVYIKCIYTIYFYQLVSLRRDKWLVCSLWKEVVPIGCELSNVQNGFPFDWTDPTRILPEKKSWYLSLLIFFQQLRDILSSKNREDPLNFLKMFSDIETNGFETRHAGYWFFFGLAKCTLKAVKLKEKRFSIRMIIVLFQSYRQIYFFMSRAGFYPNQNRSNLIYLFSLPKLKLKILFRSIFYIVFALGQLVLTTDIQI